MTTTISSTATQFYSWKGYRCAYEFLAPEQSQGVPLLLLHPIGVGLSRHFWRRFCQEWSAAGQGNPIYNPDLLGNGDSEMPRIAYYPEDWAEQLQYFLETVVKTPVVLVVQGAEFPVAIALTHRYPELVKGLVLSGPPAWVLVSQESPDWRHRVNWNLFDSPLGSAFYRYARRSQFLQSFSKRQLFAAEQDIDAEWLTMLQAGAENLDSRHAVFSFLAGFWRRDWSPAIAHIQQPTLVVVGEQATSISREGKQETPDARIADYLQHFPNAEGIKIAGRNVLPYEETTAFVQAMIPFVQRL